MKVAVASAKDSWQLWQYRHLLTCEDVGGGSKVSGGCLGLKCNNHTDYSENVIETFPRFVEDSEVQKWRLACKMKI